MTIDDERAAFMRDLLRVLTSLYSWAGAVVHGQTEDGHDVIELCDGTRVWTAELNAVPYWKIVIYQDRPIDAAQSRIPSKRMWKSVATVAGTATYELLLQRSKEIISGPSEDK